jgi:hypothetical protein
MVGVIGLFMATSAVTVWVIRKEGAAIRETLAARFGALRERFP